MTNLELFCALGSISPENLAEAEEMQLTPPEVHKRPVNRILLIAAMVAMLALLTTACAVVYSRIHMKLVQHNPASTAQALTVTSGSEAGESVTAAPNVLTACYPQLLPEGYHLSEGAPVDYTTRNIYYWNDAGSYITLSLSTGHDSDIHLAPPVTETALKVSGWDALLSVTEKGAQVLKWQDEDKGSYLTLFTQDMEVDLAAMAEGVAFGEELPLSFLCKEGELWEVWYPQKLPEGYTLAEVSPPGMRCQNLYYTDGTHTIRYVVSLSEDLGDTDFQEEVTREDIQVAGDCAKLVTTASGRSYLFWRNEVEGFYAMLDAENKVVDLVAMAEGVAPGAPLKVSKSYLGPDYTIDLQQDPTAYVGFEPVYPQSVPEGYSAAFISDPAYGEQVIQYENALGDKLIFTLYFRLGQWGRQFEGMGQPEQVTINGKPGYRMGTTLIWTDESRGFGFCLQSGGDLDLLAIAESVGSGPELRPTNADKTEEALRQLGDYQITGLPDGMVEDGLTGWPLEGKDDWYSYVRRWYFDHKTNKAVYFEYESYVSDAASPEDVARMKVGDAGTVESVTVGSCPGVMSQDGSNASLAWVQGDAAKGTDFKLFSTDYTAEELLKIAESVALVPGD